MSGGGEGAEYLRSSTTTATPMPNLRPTFSAVIEPAHPAMIAVHLRAFSWLAVRAVLQYIQMDTPY